MNAETRAERRAARRTFRRENPLSRLIFGLVLLTVGTLFWLDQIGKIDASEYLHLWPLLLVAIGLSSLVQGRWASGAIWMLIGAAFLLPDSGWETVRYALSLWPLVISLGGLTLVMQAVRSFREPNWFDAMAVMAGNVSSATGSGSAIAVMGGCEIAFRDSKAITGDIHLDVLAFWGGIDVTVPAGWQVVDNVAEIFGAFEDKTAPPRENAPRLIVRGSAIMGGVEVKSLAETAA